MNETNYCAHAIDDLGELAKGYSGVAYDSIKRVAGIVSQSIKFRLPDNGSLLFGTVSQRIQWNTEYSRLPYKIIALEWLQMPIFDETRPFLMASDGVKVQHPKAQFGALGRKPTRRLIVAFETEADGDSDPPIAMFDLAAVAGGSFELHPYMAIYDHDEVTALDILTNKFVTNPHDAAIDFAKAISVLSEFRAALACSNVHVDADLSGDAALNKKRVKYGKTPFFSYKTLVLSTNGSHSEKVGISGLTHASPRVHLRRGHVRRLPDKMVWVNACVVGDKSLGMVSKDYRVTSGAAV